MTSRRGNDGDRSYTKVTRYIIREDDDDNNDARSSYTSRRRDSPERETIRITRRAVDDRESVASPRRSVPTYVERDLVIPSRDEAPRSPRAWERQEDTTDKELVIRRTETRDEGYRGETDRESLAITKVDDRRDTRGYDYSAYRNDDYGRDRDLQHYTRTAEYYGPQQPQTIIIRQEPIIIRERIRDDDYQVVRKSDIDEERSVATTRRDEPRDEEYFYEKKVRERYDDSRDYDDRRSRRELSPHDSISQVGARRRSYSSDDSMVYVKRVEKTSSRSSSREQKKDLAAGVIAGVGAAELLRNHRKKEGKEASSGIGRIGKDVGAGAIGALAAEGIRRYRSKSRHGSRERERERSESFEREGYGRDSRRGRSRSGRSRSRSRSESRPSLKTLGALGLGAVAVAAAASFATNKMNEKDKDKKGGHRSRSRRRRGSRGSVESLSDLENDPSAKDARNPSKRNQKVAAMGAVGAAAAALLDRARSKSRGPEGSRERSRSRVRQGVPIAVAGIGTAALTSLYEKNKAKREAEEIQHKERARSRSRSANRRGSRSDARYDDRTRSVDPYVSWGEGEIAGNNYGPEYYGRPAPSEPFYGNEGAMVPAGRTRSRSRSLSRDRRATRSRSVSSDDGRRRSSRNDSTAAIGAAAGAVAASEHEKRKAERRERKARRRAQEAQEAGRDQYEDAYAPQQPPQPPWTPPTGNDAYASQQGFGAPYQSQFPPPPGSNFQNGPNQFQPQYHAPAPAPTPQPAATGRYTPQNAYQQQQPYNPQMYPPPPQGGPPQHGYNDQFNAGGATPYPQQPLNRGTPDQNVSAGYPFSQHAPSNNDQRPSDGVSNTRSLNTTPIAPAPIPAIHIEPPSAFSSTPRLDIPQTYVPPADRPENQVQHDQNNERRVQFASPSNESHTPEPDHHHHHHHRSDTMESDDLSPDARRQRRRQQESQRGYEAGDDTDLSPNSERRASKHGPNRDQANDSSGNNNLRSNRASDRSLNPEDNINGRRRSSELRRDRRSSRSGSSRDRPPSPTESDATIDLPPRFDEKGRKKTQQGEESDRIDDILKGKGAAGKYFGNFMDGLFGPEGRSRSRGGDDDKTEGGNRRR